MKILVVEDEPKLAGFIKKGLEEQGWEVEVAFDGRMGKYLAVGNPFDILAVSYTHLDVYKRQRSTDPAADRGCRRIIKPVNWPRQ